MKVQYRITEDDYVEAARLHAWRHLFKRPSTMRVVSSGFFVVIAGILIWNEPAAALGVAFAIVVLAVLFTFVLLVVAPRRARRHYRHYAAIQDTIAVELTEAGLKHGGTDGEVTLPWTKILRWRQNHRFILIYVMPVLYYILPKSIEREGFEVPRLLQYLAEKVGPER